MGPGKPPSLKFGVITSPSWKDVYVEVEYGLSCGSACGVHYVDPFGVQVLYHQVADNLGYLHNFSQRIFTHVRDIDEVIIRYDQSVTLKEWMNVQKCRCLAIPVDKGPFFLTFKNPAENAAVRVSGGVAQYTDDFQDTYSLLDFSKDIGLLASLRASLPLFRHRYDNMFLFPLLIIHQ